MPKDIHQIVLRTLESIEIPYAGGVSVADIARFEEISGRFFLRIELGMPASGIEEILREELSDSLSKQGVKAELEFTTNIPSASPANTQNRVAGVKNIVAVASGKGGVGKSTTSVNLALALAQNGARVGVLDADIYGPSQPQMLGVGDKRPEMKGPNMIEPIEALGLKLISMGNLVTEKTPMVWRGPMVSGALQQLLQNTHWDDIDYLIIDMPPGTGDIQLTLSQSVPVTGAVIVTTPQNIALLDAKKGIEMFRKVNIPVLGVVENMSTHTCSKCGHKEAIFGEEGGDTLAEEYGTSVLGRLPLTLSIREQTDAGLPPVAAEPDSDISLEYRKIAMHIAGELWRQSLAGNAGPEISIADD